MLGLGDVLRDEGIAPADVNVMLHSPGDARFAAVMPGLARTRRGILEAYCALHSRGAERALSGGRPWVAVFLATAHREGGRRAVLFLGLYENRGGRRRPAAEMLADPDVDWLVRNTGEYQDIADRPDWTWFDLHQSARMAHLQGRLVVLVRLTPNYVRLAENLDAPIHAIHAEGAFDAAPPDWREMIVTGPFLRVLPPGWAARLREWRGIYHIVDESDGARYVGAAYGAENLLGRWTAHVAGGRGVTVGLARRDPARFRFSILDLVSPAAPAEEVIALEQTWMERLDTIRFGLNRSEEPDHAA